MITDIEQMDHAKSHTVAVVQHLQAAKELVKTGRKHAGFAKMTGGARDFSKAAGNSYAGAALEIGGGTAQQHMSRKHLASLIGRSPWDGSPEFAIANSNNSALGQELKLAADAIRECIECIAQGDMDKAGDACESLCSHLDKAEIVAQLSGDAIGHALAKPSDSTEKASQYERLIAAPPRGLFSLNKNADGTETFSMFIPMTKATSILMKDEATGKLVESLIVDGCASVADYMDDQGDVPTPEFLKEAMDAWAAFGNIRLQHDPHSPIGTINNPKIGKLPDGIEPCGWWMGKHPVTQTDAAFIRAHIYDDKAVKMFKMGALPGFSVGGNLEPNGGAIEVEVEVDEMGRVDTAAIVEAAMAMAA